MSAAAAAHERELAAHRSANLRARQVITSLNLAEPHAEEVTNVIDIDTIRAALDACNQGNVYEKYLAREDLGDEPRPTSSGSSARSTALSR